MAPSDLGDIMLSEGWIPAFAGMTEGYAELALRGWARDRRCVFVQLGHIPIAGRFDHAVIK